MELDIIRENKKHEIINSVCDLVNKYEDQRYKAEERTSKVINRYYHYLEGLSRKRKSYDNK
jgi:hypothetical protein